jgi:L-ascorbate metabolism protein UlaG (beta-lactamase superfamily)
VHLPRGVPLPRSVGAPATGRTFHNRLQTRMVEQMRRTELARDFALKGRSGRPSRPVPMATPAFPEQAADCAVTWLGHASVLLEVGGHHVLADPMWSQRCSPSQRMGPKRLHPVPVELSSLPQDLAAVVISHDHYDHLDTATVDWLVAHREVPFVVPLGIGDHLRRWGVPEARIVELEWGGAHTIGDLTLTCTEAQHFSGRWLTNNTTLWSSWVVAARGRRVFFGGDTGYTPAFADIGAQHGPFDLSVLPIGAYDHRWADVHMDPAEALQTHRDLAARTLLPIHWATFDLAFHPWSEPIERLLAEAGDVRVATPRPGERFEVDGELPRTAWWR